MSYSTPTRRTARRKFHQRAAMQQNSCCPRYRFLPFSSPRSRDRPSPLECRIDRYAIAVGEAVGLVRHADNGHELAEHRRAHAGLARRCAVTGDAIAAAVGGADREIDHLLGEHIERARCHDLLDALPGALERRRILREIFPEIIHILDLPRALDVVEHGTDFRCGVAIFDRSVSAHAMYSCE